MNVLFAAAEGSPFVKTGGLADVIGALPKALRKEGVDVRIVLPKYQAVSKTYREKMKLVAEFQVPVGWRMVYCGLWELTHEGITVYFIDNEHYFKREGVYGYGDDGERFSYYCRAVLEMLRHVEFIPDVIHTHDWHTGMVGALLDKHYRHDERYAAIRNVFTIHNLQFQGVFPYEVLSDLLGLDQEYFSHGKVEFHGNVNFLKAGLVFADRVTTVSGTYAEEIRTPEYGEGLDGELRYLGSKLSGIVNGIDEKVFNPATDPHIYMKYRTNLAKKRENKTALQRMVGLPERPEVPVIGMVSRITVQKGFDLVADAIDGLMEHDDVQIVILGAGDYHYEQLLLHKSLQHPEKLAVQLKFDEHLAHQIYAGSDMFLMPSRFEPCGISQLLAMRYGSLPIVRETGGLKDTVQSYNEFTGEGNGFTFGPYTTHDMVYTIRRALHFYHMPDNWKAVVKNAFAGDYSWSQSARKYLELYEAIAGGSQGATDSRTGESGAGEEEPVPENYDPAETAIAMKSLETELLPN
ncbi:glycogen synthase GlgA [Paenibacillus tarimensis]|uniref:glycogen synthase GlgA n=1 Tax=Paenibacillus tarimensis TaxID=416012 RepID=UPI001F474461|nr:glycogen synthase GlgA [Paenibacillus tarimensis]MCF2943511.1 glycogen synthase GlgA [Paenibacillus tarimensis]